MSDSILNEPYYEKEGGNFSHAYTLDRVRQHLLMAAKGLSIVGHDNKENADSLRADRYLKMAELITQAADNIRELETRGTA